jgi:hypothetical protein
MEYEPKVNLEDPRAQLQSLSLQYLSNNNQVLKCTMRLKDAIVMAKNAVRAKTTASAMRQSELARRKDRTNHSLLKDKLEEIKKSFGYTYQAFDPEDLKEREKIKDA